MKIVLLLACLFATETMVAENGNLLACWTFANGSLKSDTGDFEFQENNGGLLEVGKGSVTLIGSKVLSCTAISAASRPELQGSVTLWARVKFDELPQSGELGVLGLQSGTDAGGWPALILAMLYRSMPDDPVNAGLGFLARAQGTEELGVGSDLFQKVGPGEFVDVALVFDGAANTAALWVDRTGVWAESKREHAALLENFDALLVGKLISPGADTAVTFDEVRVYAAALDPGGLAGITARKD